MTRIGILSDTHGLLDPRIKTHFADTDEIWHAGDIGSSEVLAELRQFKPTRAVYGNCDSGDIRYELSEFYRFRVEQCDILMTHIGGYPGKYNPLAWRKIAEQPPHIFVCGHSHILKVQYDRHFGCLHINPGAAGKYGIHMVQTLVRLAIDGEEIKDLEVIELARK